MRGPRIVFLGEPDENGRTYLTYKTTYDCENLKREFQEQFSGDDKTVSCPAFFRDVS